jgi:hypothetical protein
MRFGFARGFGAALATIASLALLQLAGAPEARCDDVAAQTVNLSVNPVLARRIPPPGWIADNRDTWVSEHPVYKQACKTSEVTAEIFFLNRIIANDDYLLTPVGVPRAQLATEATDSMLSEIDVASALAARLQALPDCAVGKPQSATVATAAAAIAPGPPESGPLSPSSGSATNDPQAGSAERLLIRFDDRIAALTPSSIRAFDKAVIAARNGTKVQLAIDGCDTGADFSNGSPCARRLLSLKELLAANGVQHSQRLLADIR